MKFKIQVKAGNDTWWEDYDKNVEDAHAWAVKTIEQFNATLHPKERSRVLLDVVVLDMKSIKEHAWVKCTGGMSVEVRGRGSLADLVYCSRCGVTGKRFGIGQSVTIDSAFKRKAFQRCDTALEEMRHPTPKKTRMRVPPGCEFVQTLAQGGEL